MTPVLSGLLAFAVGWWMGRRSYTSPKELLGLLRGRYRNETVYVRPPGLTQTEQCQWIRAVEEVEKRVGLSGFPKLDRRPLHKRVLGLDTFSCVLCDKEPTYTMACGLCDRDRFGNVLSDVELGG